VPSWFWVLVCWLGPMQGRWLKAESVPDRQVPCQDEQHEELRCHKRAARRRPAARKSERHRPRPQQEGTFARRGGGAPRGRLNAALTALHRPPAVRPHHGRRLRPSSDYSAGGSRTPATRRSGALPQVAWVGVPPFFCL